uniref:Protein lines n=1 Tax=Glossina palpalis gambiensis TaxID=67801 RepID=A0A1B0B1X8_9MUSC
MSSQQQKDQTQQRVDLSYSNAMVLSINSNHNNNNISIEQPQTKRQKIEKTKAYNGKNLKNCLAPTVIINGQFNSSPPPDIVDTGDPMPPLCSSLSSSSHSISAPTSSNNSPTITPSSSRTTSLTQLLNAQNLIGSVTSKQPPHEHLHVELEVARSNNGICSPAEFASDEVDRVGLPDLLTLSTPVNGANNKFRCTVDAGNATTTQLDELSAAQDMREFEESLTKQCLCGVSERMLRKPFQSHYSLDANGQKRIANLNEWPTNKLLQFLSNLQLLFDIYLKQNSKGFICARIMDVCDALIRNDHHLIDEIIVLAGYRNPYVQFLASRVLASFLVIAKQDMDDDWLKKLVDNLFNFDRLDYMAVQKVHFSLEIIKRIVEWKDIDLHPLEDEIVDTHINMEASSSNAAANRSADVFLNSHHGYLHFQTQQPTLERNYFAVHYRSSDSLVDNSSRESPETSTSYNAYHNTATLYGDMGSQCAFPSAALSGCHLITLTDSESFDTTHLKCITIKILENKWPALVKNMSILIESHLDIENAEHCILNFLQLWENIISVKANLSIVETLPFYAQLDKFEMLLNQNLSCTVYKQILCLFNEALCYGSTLALQDMLPDETCVLARQIVTHVKDSPILESLPRRHPENVVGFIGFKRKPIIYENGTLQRHYSCDATSSVLSAGDVIEMDKTLLQKMVLLVLKSIAVTVKAIRSDSSDSSIDTTDYAALQEMVLIENSIRAVLIKLESFIKHTLEFHPECHFSKILIHLFDDQDDHLIEAMVCTLDVTITFPALDSMLNPVYTFLEFLKMVSNSSDLLLDLLVSNETCFLLYLLRFLKYIRANWPMFVRSCDALGSNMLDEAMDALIRLRLQISRLVSRQLYPYDISPVLRLLENCEDLYQGNELS